MAYDDNFPTRRLFGFLRENEMNIDGGLRNVRLAIEKTRQKSIKFRKIEIIACQVNLIYGLFKNDFSIFMEFYEALDFVNYTYYPIQK